MTGPRSFGTRLVLLVTIASAAAALLVGVVLVALNYGWMHDDALEQLETQGAVIGTWSAAALTFEDADAGRDTLRALEDDPGVIAAALFDTEGVLFAEYRADGAPTSLPELRPEEPGEHFERGWLSRTTAVEQSGRQIGTLQIVYDIRAINARLRRNVLLSLGASLVATIAALLIALRLERVLARPVEELVATTRRVSTERSYRARARKWGDDELGQLTDAFNDMLAQIEQQSESLQAGHEERVRLLESERQARGEAERASRMKDEFLATLSHELRTPLSAVLGWAQVLRRGANSPNQVQEGLEVIERNARAQAQIIEDLLDMSRIISGRLRLDVQLVKLAELIEAALATVRPAAEAKGIRLQTVLDPNVGMVRGDPARLQQVVWNLLSNAIKFTPRDGRVQVVLERVDSHVEIAVSDTGQGIEPEFLPVVFERFRQGDQSTTRRHGGLGLGLALVKQFVELHGGSVEVKSDGAGQGSTFTVELPLAVFHEVRREREIHPRAARAVPLGEPSISLDTVRVLVVDDEPDARELIRVLLEDSGAKVATSASVAEALDVFDHFQPHVLVSDIGMPGRDGYDLISEVRGRGRANGGAVPAIALTAFARSEDRTRALLAGYQMHVAKPVEPTELIASVASLAGVTNDGGGSGSMAASPS